MQAVGVNADGRTVVMITVAEAREMIKQRLAIGREAFATRAGRKDADVRKVVASLERGIPGEQAGV
ncbi:hypothetical protein OIU34_17535 [Pararhizobium sp. BT-229]|uniref:hypothetical protein n=1 Tax=Pararhizobium sp. BT-229 TaxID=2986923 RepID=UPI0021F6F55F|nr:hypothetical protein [Pararhizobium sp. BT-229]MCV9963701.1 hypothetical protein [Pararhizobium sp. BT-229]